MLQINSEKLKAFLIFKNFPTCCFPYVSMKTMESYEIFHKPLACCPGHFSDNVQVFWNTGIAGNYHYKHFS